MLADGERMPVYVHVIDHPDARVLVDTAIAVGEDMANVIRSAAGAKGHAHCF